MQARKTQNILACWGLNSNGQGGIGKLSNKKGIVTPQPVRGIGSHAIRCVSAGGMFSAAVTAEGKLYTWGSGRRGRLGLGSEEDKLLPTIVSGLGTLIVLQVSCGDWHTMLLDDAGRVWTTGAGTHGCLGHNDEQDLMSFKRVEGLSTPSVQVSAGRQYSAAVARSGRLFTWGWSKHGKTGHGTQTKQLKPKPIKALEEQHIVFVDLGYEHAAAVTEAGALYVWGKGEYGNIGNGEKSDCLVPTRVEALADVHVQLVACSKGKFYCHTACTSTDGALFTWGSDYKGKLGHHETWQHGMQTDELLPRRVENIEPVVGLACGGIHMAAIGQSGRLHTWGCGSNGRLGHPESDDHTYLYREGVPRCVETFTEGGLRATLLACSYYHNLAYASAPTEASQEQRYA
eukprot:GILK01014538.1.p1 GENE.GILK01014538.1~~GILK01014538.1.p1  ORF type:complete len:416 (+),score=44.06 GILK01014538.1:46-1248(+)